MKREIKIDKPFYRTIAFDRSAVNEVTRTVRLSISSDEPMLRDDFFGQPYYEVLDHSPGGIVADRLKAGTPLLFDHSRSEHLGRNVDFTNDGHKVTVVSKFSRSAFAQEKWQDVLDGILVDSSVGYEVLDVQELDQEIDGVPIYKMKWQPLEASLVTIPADFTVGVGRNAASTALVRQHMKTEKTTTEENDEHAQPNQRTATQERQRINDIRALAKLPTFKRFVNEDDVQKAIDAGTSKRAFTDFVMQQLGEFGETIITTGDDPRHGNTARTIGEMIVSNPETRRFLAGAGQRNASFELKGVRAIRQLQHRASAIVGTGDVGQAIMRLPTVQGVALERLVVADLLAPGATDAGVVLYPRENSWTTQAGFVDEMAIKPTQTFDLVPDQAAVKKIAALAKVSDELFQDTPGSMSYITTRLLFSVEKSEDNALLNGSGVGSQIKGILTTPGLQAISISTQTSLDAIRQAIALVEVSTDFHVSGIVIHPQNWSTIEQSKDLNLRYMLAPVLIPDEFGIPKAVQSLWGKPVVLSKSIPVGTALVGAFDVAAQLFRRTGLVIQLTNSDVDDFQRNLIAIRAEERVALAVYNGSAFCAISGLS